MNLHSAVGNRKWKTLASLVAVSVLLFLLAPPAARRVDIAGWNDLAARTVAGAYHVHTVRSDGHGDKAAVAAAAARAGLAFAILTDHGDGTRPPDPPEYVDGVLMLDAVEISTDEGHYVALDMPRAPYPLGGAADAVVEDVHRLGGFGIAAHPDSPKAALRWTDTTAPIDGIEWINADSEWRDETRGRLVRAGLGYLFRPAAALASLLDRPATLDRWQTLLENRRVVALGAADAHGGPGRRVEEQRRSLLSTIGIPSYEASFRELSVRAVLDRPFSGNAAADAHALFAAIRAGRVFTVIDALASPALLDLRAVPSGAGVSVAAGAAMPRDGQLVLIGPKGELARAGGELRFDVPADRPGAYRVEVHLPGAPGEPPVPWLVSNPVYVGAFEAPSREASFTRPDANVQPSAPAVPLPWRIEKDAASSAILRTARPPVELEYRLADGPRRSQFVALAADLAARRFTAIDLRLRGDRPGRVSVQVRAADGRRWGRSVYVPSNDVAHLRLPLSAMRPLEQGSGAVPAADALTSILLVVDLTNALPGTAGHLYVMSSELVN